MSISDRFRHSLRAILSYAVAVVSVSAAVIVTLGFGTAMKHIHPTTFFFCAIVLSSWFGGLWPGILAALLSTIAVDYCFIPPIGAFGPISPEDVPELIVFAASALFVSWLNGEQKRANVDLARENRDRRKAEEALRASERRLQDIVGNSTAVISSKISNCVTSWSTANLNACIRFSANKSAVKLTSSFILLRSPKRCGRTTGG
jgi:K+-sensing histidine kinase KdpD